MFKCKKQNVKLFENPLYQLHVNFDVLKRTT